MHNEARIYILILIAIMLYNFLLISKINTTVQDQMIVIDKMISPAQPVYFKTASESDLEE